MHAYIFMYLFFYKICNQYIHLNDAYFVKNIMRAVLRKICYVHFLLSPYFFV